MAAFAVGSAIVDNLRPAEAIANGASVSAAAVQTGRGGQGTGGRVDILINNAGTARQDVCENVMGDFRQVLDVI
jgi:NAD(P)-dependent dehydrogenase (short-subunit alcohol dehydrogenase family)